MKTLYKSLPADIKPNGFQFKEGVWNKIDGEIQICNRGFHASKNIIDAMGYVNCGVLARVEVRGEHEIQADKECWSEMKIVKTYKWTKKDSVALAIYAAELVIDIYEKECPNGKLPREAIEAAKRVLKSDTPKNRAAAARAADAAARAAAYAAAYAAAAAAYAAADAAADAAAYAAAAADAAADAAARAAAAAAARNKIRKLCHEWILKRTLINKP